MILAAGCGGSELAPERIPGTERLAPEGGYWFSVSQNEELLAFMEIDSGYAEPPAQYKLPPTFHIVTLELKSGGKTHHHLREIPTGTFTYPVLTPWQLIRGGFDAAGWFQDTLYVQCWQGVSRNPWIAFAHGTPAALRVEEPRELGCADCPPREIVQRVAKSLRIDSPLPGEISIPFKDGRVSEHVYLGKRDGDRVRFIRRDLENKVKVVVKHGKALCELTAEGVRASPDERYLAYGIGVRLKLPIPTPATPEIYVYDMRRRRRVRVPGVFRTVSSFIWSPDSKRLYFAATSGVAGNGVYRFTVGE